MHALQIVKCFKTLKKSDLFLANKLKSKILKLSTCTYQNALQPISLLRQHQNPFIQPFYCVSLLFCFFLQCLKLCGQLLNLKRGCYGLFLKPIRTKIEKKNDVVNSGGVLSNSLFWTEVDPTFREVVSAAFFGVFFSVFFSCF